MRACMTALGPVYADCDDARIVPTGMTFWRVRRSVATSWTQMRGHAPMYRTQQRVSASPAPCALRQNMQ